jgi:hypothetical protein
VLFQGSAGQAEKSGSFWRPQISLRQAGVRIGHLRGSVIVSSATALGRALTVTMAE